MFEKWKVKLSTDSPSPSELNRRSVLESTRGRSDLSPGIMRKLEYRQLARQSQYRQRNPDNGETSKSSSWQSALTDGAATPGIPTQEFPDGYHNGKALSNGFSKEGRHLICDGSLDFKNGEGENIGRLILETPQSIDLYTITGRSPLMARWEEQKSSLINAIKSKEKEIDKRIVGWTERRMSGVLPWAISRAAEMSTSDTFAVEHIRGGNLGIRQKVLQTYIW
jgi:hypothetical protein